MDEIIAFLARNFYFVLIFLFFLYSTFSKNKKQEQKQQRMPTFGGEDAGSGPQRSPRPQQPVRPSPQQVRPEPSQARPERSEAAKRAYHGQQDVYMSTSSVQYAEDEIIRRRAQDIRERASADGGIGVASLENDLTKASTSSSKRHEKALSREELRRAIVWSEILNRPRSVRSRRRY